MLKHDEKGRVIVRQSDLSSFGYCPARQFYDHNALAAGYQPSRLSATVVGSVKHYALLVFQRLWHEGREDAEDVALATFDHYWTPEHCGEICEGFPTEWMRGHTYEGLREEAHKSLRAAFAWIKRDRSWLLAVEHTFDVPFWDGNEEVVLHGTVDRLTLVRRPEGLFISVDDWKSGKRTPNLSLAVQWSVYAKASLHPDFWLPFYAEDTQGFDNLLRNLADQGWALHDGVEGLEPLPRRGRLLEVKDEGFGAHDCGVRGQAHYARLAFHVREYLKAERAGVHPPTTEYARCLYCPWNNGVCGEAPIPELQDVDQTR